MQTTKTTSFTNDEYRAIDAWSKSDLDNANKSVALLEWSKSVNRTKSDVADIGNAVHAALLEPDVFVKEYIKMPKFDKRTKIGKEQAAAFEETMIGKTVLSSDDFEMVIAMRDSALAHPIVNKLLTSKGESEVSIFFNIDGVKCKCRPDRIVDPEVFNQHIIVDVKTSADADKFARSSRDYRYHVQDAFYSDGYEALTGFKPRFLFAVIGKNKVFGSHPVRLFELDEDSKEEGRMTYLDDLSKVKEAKEFGMAEIEVETLTLPKKW